MCESYHILCFKEKSVLSAKSASNSTGAKPQKPCSSFSGSFFVVNHPMNSERMTFAILFWEQSVQLVGYPLLGKVSLIPYLRKIA